MNKNKLLLIVSMLVALPLGLSCIKYQSEPINEPQIAFADEISDESTSEEIVDDSTSDENDIYDTLSQWSIDVRNALDSVGAIVGISGLTLLSIVFTAIKLLIPNKKGLKKIRDEYDPQFADIVLGLNGDKEAIAKIESKMEQDKQFYLSAIELLAKLSRNAKAQEIVEQVKRYANGGK